MSYQYTQLEEVLTDVDDPQSELPCIDCGVEEFIPLCWYQYDDQAHAHGDVKLCMHCNYPLPKNEDFVMCSNQRHTLCLYCLELKLFRIALGRFVAVMFHICIGILYLHFVFNKNHFFCSFGKVLFIVLVYDMV